MPEDDRPVPPVVVKKYANRRLYDTESSIYITLDTLADMVRRGRDFVVYDAKTGDDITRAVLTQIIMEEEIRGRNMLPTAFLRQLIGFYGDSRQGLVPDYLEHMMEQFSAQQHQLPTSIQRVLPSFKPPDPHEPGRPELAIMDQAVSLFPPTYRPGPEGTIAAAEAPRELPHATSSNGRSLQDAEELATLHEEVARLREELARASAAMTEPAGVLRTAGGGIRH